MTERTAPAVRFDVPVERVFAYLSDPANRPAWQSSLRRVELLDPGPAHVGQRWIDVTAPGLRPLMTTTVLDAPRRWVERGTWRGLTLRGELAFTPTATGCTVSARATFAGRKHWRGVVPLLRWAARRAVLADLRRAAGLLAADAAAAWGASTVAASPAPAARPAEVARVQPVDPARGLRPSPRWP